MSDVKGIEEVLTRMGRRQVKLRDLTSPMGRAVTDVYAAIQGNFRAQGSDLGPWAPLQPLTLKRKLADGGSSLILIGAPRRQHLGVYARGKRKGQPKYGKILSGGSAGALMRDWDLTVTDRGKTGTVKSRHYYGTFHQEGGRYLPVRRITPSEARSREIVRGHFTQHRDEVVDT